MVELQQSPADFWSLTFAEFGAVSAAAYYKSNPGKRKYNKDFFTPEQLSEIKAKMDKYKKALSKGEH